MQAIGKNPAVYAAVSKIFEQYGMTLQVNPNQTSRRLAIEPTGHALDAPEDVLDSLPRKHGPLATVLSALDAAFGDAGRTVVQYVQRMKRRMDRLFDVLHSERGVEEVEGKQEVESKEDAEVGDNKPGNIIFDILFTGATLLVLVTMLGRVIPVPLHA
jgi:hypothetical protein